MKAFTDKQALELGRSILSRFEEGLNGSKWQAFKVVLPFQLELPSGGKLEYPRQMPWTSSVEMSLPSFIRVTGPSQWDHITLNEWLETISHESDDSEHA